MQGRPGSSTRKPVDDAGFGAFLRELCDACGLRDLSLAIEAGTDRSILSRVFTSNRHAPDSHVIEWCRVLKLNGEDTKRMLDLVMVSRLTPLMRGHLHRRYGTPLRARDERLLGAAAKIEKKIPTRRGPRLDGKRRAG